MQSPWPQQQCMVPVLVPAHYQNDFQVQQSLQLPQMQPVAFQPNPERCIRENSSPDVASHDYEPRQRRKKTLVTSEAVLSTLCQKLESQLNHDNSISDVFTSLRGHVWSLSRHSDGCRLVQSALECLKQKEAAELTLELQGHVVEAATCRHANFVLQKVIKQLACSSSRFIAEELRGSCSKLARNRCGCRVFCRLVEYHGSSEATERLIDEIIVDADSLCRHRFGHHVCQSILEHGGRRHRRQLAAVLRSDAISYAQHQCSSYLVEAVLNHCHQEDQEALLMQFRNPMMIAQLALHEYGRFVARALLKHAKTDKTDAISQIRSIKQQLEQTPHGPQLLKDIGLVDSASEFSDVSSERSQF
eukprot:TRINITY_DN77065_c0_g1_i1.p1 TRINITY_DN77065_c0_g1~~TRINITY_DN77065_c0_g1_i1.p1  ORF type:complete len:412 (+),score=70.80 TRINITY_DN77065_c0_g1_i1:157-1236(+)